MRIRKEQMETLKSMVDNAFAQRLVAHLRDYQDALIFPGETAECWVAGSAWEGVSWS